MSTRKHVLTIPQARAILEAVRVLGTINATFTELDIGNGAAKFFRYSCDGGYGVSRGGRSVGEYDTLADFAVAHGLPL